MRLTELRFTAETASYGALILAMSGARALGTQIYTYGRLFPGNDHGQLWAGSDARGRLAALLLDTGSVRCLLTPESGAVGRTAADAAALFRGIPRAERLRVMVKDRPQAAADALKENGAVPLAGPALLEIFTLLRRRPPTDAEEKQYVFWTHAANAGLASACGVYDENGALAAVAQIPAKNRRYALIGNVFTREDLRGRGYASRLLSACEAEAAAEGLRPVVYCRPAMTRFYMAHGYRAVRKNEL